LNQGKMPQTKVLIINYNNGPDTISCIRSLASLADIGIILLDNASDDGSVLQIEKYLGEDDISYDATSVAGLNGRGLTNARVLFVRSTVNLGFAGGNNILLRYMKTCGDSEYAWLLNNDAIVDETALGALIRKMEEDNDVAFVGSVILDFYHRNLVQCCGVIYYKYFGVSKLLMKNVDWSRVDKNTLQLPEADFQHGASLLVRMSALDTIGLMDERYFLYFEEHDWQWTARDRGFRNVLATASIVYHKGSVSTNNKKHLFFYYYNKSAIIFARKHSSFSVRLLATIMLIGITLVRAKFYFKSVWWGLKGIAEGYTIKGDT